MDELFDMYSWLRCYLYIVFLMTLSSSSFALTDLEIAMKGFAYDVVCSHPSDLNFCVRADSGNPNEAACNLRLVALRAAEPHRQYLSTFEVFTRTNGVKTCIFKYKVDTVTTEYSVTHDLANKTGMCPPRDAPPSPPIAFSRQGRWFPQELPPTRCYKNCSYSEARGFSVKHYVFTNGVLSEFTQQTPPKSTQEFCHHEPEPIRNDDGEITYDASCEDNIFKTFCDFIEWFRSDADMPTSPEVDQKELEFSYLKIDHIWIDRNNADNCFQPVEFNFFLPWSRTEVKQEVTFERLCGGIYSLGNLWRALYLLAACYIIFGGRK